MERKRNPEQRGTTATSRTGSGSDPSGTDDLLMKHALQTRTLHQVKGEVDYQENGDDIRP